MLQGYVKVGDISYAIAINLIKGKDYTNKQKDLCERGIKILRILKVLFLHVRFENEIPVLYRIEEEQVNALLKCLIRLADLDKYPIPTNYIPSYKDIKIPIRKVYNA
jgi:hypothetical protein